MYPNFSSQIYEGLKLEVLEQCLKVFSMPDKFVSWNILSYKNGLLKSGMF